MEYLYTEQANKKKRDEQFKTRLLELIKQIEPKARIKKASPHMFIWVREQADNITSQMHFVDWYVCKKSLLKREQKYILVCGYKRNKRPWITQWIVAVYDNAMVPATDQACIEFEGQYEEGIRAVTN